MSSAAYASLNRISDTVKPRLLFPNGITDLTVDLPGQSGPPPTSRSRASSAPREAGHTEPVHNKSRWKTREFYVYYLAFILVVPNMVHAVVKLSRGQSSERRLSQSVSRGRSHTDNRLLNQQSRIQTITPSRTGSGMDGCSAGRSYVGREGGPSQANLPLDQHAEPRSPHACRTYPTTSGTHSAQTFRYSSP